MKTTLVPNPLGNTPGATVYAYGCSGCKRGLCPEKTCCGPSEEKKNHQSTGSLPLETR